MQSVRLSQLINQRRRRSLARERSIGTHAVRLGFALALSLALLLALAILGAGFAFASLTEGLPSIQALPVLLDSRDGALLQPTTLYDRTGLNVIFRLENPGIQRRYLLIDPQQKESLAPQLVQVVISLFDPDFWRHPGFHWQNLTRVEPDTLAERLVLDLLLENEPASQRRALRMRLLAAQITQQYGRARVMEWYLNSAAYGHLAYGAESAAQLYLGKSGSQMNFAEAALLAAALEAPALNPLDAAQAALERQQAVLDTLVSRGILDAEQREKYRKFTYAPPAQPPPVHSARAFTTYVLEQLASRIGRSRVERGGLRVTTTLDLELQNQLSCAIKAQLLRMQGTAPSLETSCPAARLLPTLPPNLQATPASLQASAVLLNPANGQILAFVGDSTSSSESALVSLHEPGTLLTPFLAVSAFASGFSPASLVWDIPTGKEIAVELVDAKNQFRGPLRLRSALATDNLRPLKQALSQIGPNSVWQLAEPLGLTNLKRSPEPQSLLEAGGESTLVQIAQAYGAFATAGTLFGAPSLADRSAITPISILTAENQDGQRLLDNTESKSRAVLSPQLAYLANHVLGDETARWPSLGHPNALEIGRPVGAKTGQTVDGKQVWAAGYTSQNVAVIWLGLPAQRPAAPLDRRAAAGIWHAIMQYASRNLPPSGWNQPSGISTLDVCDPSGLLPTTACPTIVSEVFLNGNEPAGLDNLYQVFQINRETNRLATIFTPPELIEERTFLVIPAEAQAWGRLAGLPVPPADYDVIQPPPPSAEVNILQPTNFSAVRGQVAILGSAAGYGFTSYRLQAGAGLNPKTWIQIGQQSSMPVRDGKLATWDTPAESGLYALRLQVIRQDQRVETAIIQVTVDNTPPRVRIQAPLTGQKVKAGGAAFTLQAEAADSIGIQRVEFWMDGQLAGTRLAAPFTHPWQPLPGSHQLVVKAVDVAGNVTETTPLQFMVE